MKRLFLYMLCLQLGFASTYTLKDVMRISEQNNAMKKALKQEALARTSRNLAETAGDPFEISGIAGRAYPDAGRSGNEYAMGIKKKLYLNHIQEEEQYINSLNDEAYLLDAQKSILSYRNGLKNIYHRHCLEYGEYRTFSRNYSDFVTLYKKKAKAYHFHEISKKELMQLELEKNRLYAKLQGLKMKQEISKQSLFRLTVLSASNNTLSCQDLYPVRSHISLGEKLKLSKEAYKKRLARTHAKLNRYSHGLESVDLSAIYSNEIDTDRYGIGVSVPLTFTSRKSEHERAAAMYESSAVSYAHEQNMREKENSIAQLQAQIKSQAFMVKMYERNYRDYVQKLLPLSRKSYDLGETSVIEYLLTQQQSYQMREEMFRAKKAYYQTLFQLYTMSEKKDKR